MTNTFGGNASRLKLHGGEAKVHEINKVAAEIAREVVDKSGRTVVVAGSVGPTGDIMVPMGSLTHESAVEMFHEQAEGLKAGGADVLWCETISAPEEYKAAAEAMVKMVGKLPNPPLAFGANCGVGASDLLRTVLGFQAAGPDVPMIAKGNAGIPKYVDGHIHYDGTPDLMADYACLARDSGATIIGGCCGTTPDHLRAMRNALETRPKGALPTLEAIDEALGGFSSASDGTDGAGPTRAPRRGRRRS